jgi:geranylgeranyl pyrophosphate synthase
MPTEQQYLQMVINKTSVLPRMCVRIISEIMGDEKITPKQQKDMCSYVEKLGAAFQIQDDIISIISDDYAKSRGILAEDIHEGKKSLMVINSYYGDVLSQEKKDRLVEILNMGTTDEKILREACDLLHESGSVDYAQKYARQMIAEAWVELKEGLPEDTPNAK